MVATGPDQLPQEWEDVGETVFMEPWWRRWFGRARAPRAVLKATPVCENNHVIPANYFNRDSVRIALVGLSRSSKSHFIAATTQGLMRGSQSGRLICELQGDANRAMYERYYGKYAEGEVLDTTQRELDEDGNVRLRSPIHLVGRVRGEGAFDVEQNVLIYDCPGELCERTADMADLQYLEAADVVLYFVDAMALPDDGEFFVSADRDDTVRRFRSSAFTALRENLAVSRRERIPMGIVVSKCDLLIGNDERLEEYQKHLERPPHYDDRPMSELLRGQAERSRVANHFVREHCRSLWELATSEARNVEYFLVSATGCRDREGKYPHIQPFACMDPILWAIEAAGWEISD